MSEEVDLAFVDMIVAKLGDGPESLIPILQAMQEHYRYLPAEAITRLCAISRIAPAAVSGVSTFYSQFRHHPVGKHIVKVCHGTACHVKNAGVVEDAIRRHLHMEPGQETDACGEFTIERVGCLGCCTLAPVVQVDEVTLGHTAPDTASQAVEEAARQPPALPGSGVESGTGTPDSERPRIHIGVGSCCVAGGSQAVRTTLEEAVRRMGIDVLVKPVGCVGMCHQTPLVEVVDGGVAGRGGASALYAKVTEEEAAAIVRRHFRPAGVLKKMTLAAASLIDRLMGEESEQVRLARHAIDVRDKPVDDFLGRQRRLATEYCGSLNPLDIEEYMSHDGFVGLRKCLELADSGKIVEEIKGSGLRGRGGAGFPTGVKWERALVAAGGGGADKYIICNGDEGDPGAFMDRMILESYPYRVLEGMIIGAIAIGARQGILYIRHEYPLAVKRIRAAIERCRERNLLGENILGSSYSLDLRVMEGAGAFVCGEETALMASIEGRRGMPRLRPPFPTESGLWGKPSCINNVETLAMVPWIIRHGAAAFAAFGTKASKGTKVFALTGKVRRGGLIEVPMGITIRQIVEDIGGGVANHRQFKAVQIGGPSGGCIPAELGHTSVDYESLRDVGAIMGSGGLVVMDDHDCMVDIARYFLQFTQAESCGKCTFCRVGTQRMLEILTKLCAGEASRDDLNKLEELCGLVSRGSLCGLGQTAPNPVVTTLRYFRHEYEAHLKKQCPAGQCKALIKYQVTDECIGCTRCAQECPVGAIPLTPYQKHEIDTAGCTRCDVCRRICPANAITVASPC
ncbi:MAG: NAD(P)H-dependent oxidoreductase subunit E [Phycisphaerales bacterium]|nr:NAD(P)H-dependent oxidoreductase subunit E [Phycisphaerales bacterium]